ncbi:MAG: urease accessory UreF family protein [Pseudomonadota bacterium]
MTDPDAPAGAPDAARQDAAGRGAAGGDAAVVDAAVLDAAGLARLAAWLSPAYPVGGFAYSHGLEWAIDAGDVADAPGLERWLADLIALGAGRADAVLIAQAWAAPEDPAVAERARALAASRERLLETEQPGAAFAALTASAWGDGTGEPGPWPVAVGRAARAAGLPLAPVVTLALQGFASNLAGAAVRLVPLGQTEAQAVIARLAPLIATVAAEAIAAAERAACAPDGDIAAAALDAQAGACFRSDIAAMRHETQPVRLFRS